MRTSKEAQEVKSLPFLPAADPNRTLQVSLDQKRGALALTPVSLVLVRNEGEGVAKVDLGEDFVVSLTRHPGKSVLFLELRQKAPRGPWTKLSIGTEAESVEGIEALPPYELDAPFIAIEPFLSLLSRLAASRDEGRFKDWHPPLDTFSQLPPGVAPLPLAKETKERAMTKRILVKGAGLPKPVAFGLMALFFAAPFPLGSLLRFPMGLSFFLGASFASILFIGVSSVSLRVEKKTILVESSPFNFAAKEIDGWNVNKVFIQVEGEHHQVYVRLSNNAKPVKVVGTTKREKAEACVDFLLDRLGLERALKNADRS